jgi:HEPN domain-containing protein
MNRELVEEWVAKAENNYISALDLAQRQKYQVPDVICNQCQQCAEKYLKALLVQCGIDFPKVHDMNQLKNLVAQVEPEVQRFTSELKSLDPYGVDVKYPGLPVSEDEAKEAIKAMKAIRRFMRAKLGLKTR